MVSGGKYLFRRLEQLLPGVVSKRYERLRFHDGVIHPVLADLEAGAAEVIRDNLQEVGDSAIVSDGAFDIPVVDIAATESRYKIMMIASGFSWTMQQMRAMDKAENADFVSSRKQLLAMRSIAERVNNLAAFGVHQLGFTGFINDPRVVADDTTLNLYTISPDEVATFFLERSAEVSIAFGGTFASANVLVSHRIFVMLNSRRMSDGAQSIASYIAANNGGIIDQITWTTEAGFASLQNAGVGVANKDRIVFYPSERLNGDQDATLANNQPEMIERHIEPAQVAPIDYWEVKGLRQVVPMFMCTTPTIINYPESMRYVDVPKKAA